MNGGRPPNLDYTFQREPFQKKNKLGKLPASLTRDEEPNQIEKKIQERKILYDMAYKTGETKNE
jgi:hypothetical protein